MIAGGDMLGQMQSKKVIPEKWAAKVIKQTLMPLNYMHKRGIMHRDVKLENLLVMPQHEGSDEIQVKLTDFGFATHFQSEEQFNLQLGSGLYMSPELVGRK
jgi:serine/threonine protein kinase